MPIAAKQGNETPKEEQMPTSNKLTINGVTYEIQEMDAYDGAVIAAYLQRKFGEGLGVLMDGLRYTEDKEMIHGYRDLAGDIMHALGKNLDDDTYAELCDKLLNNMKVDGVAVNWRKHFTRKYSALGKVLFHALKYNYEDVFFELGCGQMMSQIKKLMPTQPA